jgi:hypothetical protein
MKEEEDEVRAMIAEALGDEAPPVPEADIQAALADPVLAPIFFRATRGMETTLTEAGLAHARRMLAIVFLTHPEPLARLRAGAAQDVSGTVPAKGSSAPVTGRRRTKP